MCLFNRYTMNKKQFRVFLSTKGLDCEYLPCVNCICQQVWRSLNDFRCFVNKRPRMWIICYVQIIYMLAHMWNTKKCLVLPTGMRDDDQCQAVCQQVCEMMNNVKRLVNRCARWLTGSSGLAAEVLGCQWSATCNLFCSHQQESKLVRTLTTVS